MIKKLSLKFVLVFLVLVVSVIITSSCYAEDTTRYNDIGLLSDYGIEEITVDNISRNTFYNGSSYDSGIADWVSDNVDYLNNGTAKMLYFRYNGYDFCFLTYNYDNNSSIAGVGYYYKGSTYYPMTYWYCSGYLYVWNSNTSNWHWTQGDPTIADTSSSSHLFLSVNFGAVTLDLYCANCTGDYVRYNATTSACEYIFDSSAYVPPVIEIDTSFDYSLSGLKRGQVNLEISNLNSSLKMYGYVGCENNFNVGDVLDTSSISSYLRLISMYSDNSDLSCYLYEGEKLLYYIVDEDNVILDIGYISEMAEGDFLYGFEVYNGVDFVFLRDGQVYWDNNLTFKYSVGNSSEYEKSVIVSMGESSYITTDKTVSFTEYNGYVYDINNILLSR